MRHDHSLLLALKSVWLDDLGRVPDPRDGPAFRPRVRTGRDTSRTNFAGARILATEGDQLNKRESRLIRRK